MHSGFDDPFWTLEQTLAWIATGDRTLVSQLSVQRMFGGADQQERLLWTLLDEERSERPPIRMTLSEAAKDLLRHLQAGDLAGTARQGTLGPRVEIERATWIDLTVWFHDDVPSFGRRAFPYRSDLEDFRFERSAVLATWPERERRHSSTARGEAQARAKFVAMMRASPNLPTMTRTEAIQQARAEIETLSGRAAERAWRDAVIDAKAEAWSRAGRRGNRRT